MLCLLLTANGVIFFIGISGAGLLIWFFLPESRWIPGNSSKQHSFQGVIFTNLACLTTGNWLFLVLAWWFSSLFFNKIRSASIFFFLEETIDSASELHTKVSFLSLDLTVEDLWAVVSLSLTELGSTNLEVKSERLTSGKLPIGSGEHWLNSDRFWDRVLSFEHELLQVLESVS